jgi:uncharacterized protein (TIGR03118 family)
MEIRTNCHSLEPLEARRLLAANSYIEQDQTSDGGTSAAHTDTHLVNPWGLVAYSRGFGVSDADSGFSTSYDASGNSTGPAVHIPGPGNSQGAPTGVVYNGDTGHFEVDPGTGRTPAQFIYATEQGTIDAWATSNKNRHVVIAADRSGAGASYKGLALAKVGATPYLYAANFSKARIDVFDSNFHLFTALPGHFVDPKLPKNFSPFNIQKIGSRLFVAYAKHNTNSNEEIAGAGRGVIDIFNTDGTFVKRFAAGNTLNAPWGMAQAPSNFNAFSNDILVGNFGDGRINAFDPNTGAFKGQLNNTNGQPFEIDGLWGLAFGNGKAGTLKNGLYFTAGIDDESHGLYGRLIVDPYATPSSIVPQSVQPASAMTMPAAASAHHVLDDMVDCGAV